MTLSPGPIQFNPFPRPAPTPADSGGSHGAEGGRGSSATRAAPLSVAPVTAQSFTRHAFAPFGDAIQNPRPGRRWDPRTAGYEVVDDHENLPFPVKAANQGTALRYAPVSTLQDLAHMAPSRNESASSPTGKWEMRWKAAAESVKVPGQGPTMSMFVCSTRQLDKAEEADRQPDTQPEGVFSVSILERHPFTSQTFIPLSSTPLTKYLVIVAPTLPEGDAINPPVAASLPVPRGEGLPGAGMPDLSRLQAFVCEGYQAVTYAAGTWHAPMVVLRNGGGGDEHGDDVPLSFLVYQSNTGVALEDCQEVVFSAGDTSGQSQDGGSKPENVVGAKVIVPSFKEKPKL